MLTRASAVLGAMVLAAMGVSSAAAQDEADRRDVRSGTLTASVHFDPFRIEFVQGGEVILSTLTAEPTGDDLARRYGPLGFGMDIRVEGQPPGLAYGLFGEVPTRWFHGQRVTEVDGSVLRVETDDPAGRELLITITPVADGVIEVDAEITDATGVTATGAAFDRADGERYLGFGQRADGVDQTGNRVESWTEEGPYSSGEFSPVTDPLFGDRFQGPPPFPGSNYVVPSFVSSLGYGFLLDSTWLNYFEMASEREDAWRVDTREPRLRFRVYAGPDPADVIERYTADVGRQPEPSPWFFGPWYQPTGDREFQDDLIDFWRREDVPVTASQEYGHYLPCGDRLGMTTEERRALTDLYHEHGYKVTTYVNPFVCMNHPDGAFGEGDANGWFVRNVAGTTYLTAYAAYPETLHGMVDFTNPEARRFWQRLAAEAIDDGFDGWMEDFGEYVPPDARTSDGRTGLDVHNEYCDLYHAASHEMTWRRRGADFGQYVRCGYTGTARSARIVWQGDSMEDWDKAHGLAASISQTQSIGVSGVAYWGSDIGGFFSITQADRVGPELKTRWIEFGAFSGVMRLQAEGFSRPDQLGDRAQAWDPEVLPHWRRYAKLRTQLFPYVWDAAHEYQRTGMPITRHLALHWPDDPEVYEPEAEFQFMFGPDLLVAPVIEEGGRQRELYLPAGRWVHFWDAVDYDEDSGAFTERDEQPVLDGGRYVTVDAPLGQIPLFARARTCLELLPADVDTLADVGTRPGLVRLHDVEGQRRFLGFASDDCGPQPAPDPVERAPPQPRELPATGGSSAAAGVAGLFLVMVLLAGATCRRKAVGADPMTPGPGKVATRQASSR